MAGKWSGGLNRRKHGEGESAGPPMTENMGVRDHEFSRKMMTEVKNLARCYQCSMCSGGCPVAYAMDYFPNQIIHSVRLGLREKVLQSRSIWICSSCETCATRCPNEIEIVGLMDVLRRESLREGKGPLRKISKFHEVFVEQIRKKGRIDEGSLLLSYELKSGEFLSIMKNRDELKLGLDMFRKGKLKLPSGKRYARKAVTEIFKKATSQSGTEGD
jgi:heterodisulfide reductase subunit C